MKYINDKQHGFTLIELMVALTASMFLLGGVSLAYSSINSSTNTAKDLENALEVIHFSSTVFTRSLKQTTTAPVYQNEEFIVQQSAATQACTGAVMNAAYTERYSHEGDALFCDVGDGKIKILKGVNAIDYVIDDRMVSVLLEPSNLPTQFNNQLVIDISLSQIVMNEAFK
jgi:Tfp pilus assembly protein PilW